MYLEHEELLKLVNILERDRDQARSEAYALAHALHSARTTQLTQTVEADLLPHAINTDIHSSGVDM